MHIQRNIRSTKFQFLTIILFVVVIFLILNMILMELVTTAFMNKNIEYSRTISQKLEREFEIVAQQNKEIAKYFQYDNSIQKYFNEDLNDNFPSLMKDVENKIFSSQLLYTYVYDLALVGKQYVNSNMRNYDRLRQIAQAAPNDVQVSTVGISEEDWRQDYSSIPTLTFCTNIYSTDINSSYRQKIGNIIISINLKKIADQFTQAYEDDISFVLIDKHGEYYPINCDKNVAEKIINNIGQKGGVKSIEVDDKESLTYSSYIPSIESYLISYIDKQATKKGINYIQTTLIVVFGLTTLVICIGFIIIYNKMITPISSISYYINRVSAEGYISVKDRVEISDGNIEIVDLANNLNHMMDEINKLTRHLFTTRNQLYEKEILQKEAEVSYLRSQINPHFLYNSLEAIRGMAAKENMPVIADMTACLGKIFRYSIKGTSTAPLREELEVVKAYSNIQALRFGQKIKIIYNFQPETLDIPVIKMMLQPIIENAIQHGVEPNTEETVLYIASKLDTNILILTVQDNGCGMSENRLEEIRNCLNSGKTTGSNNHGIGLTNVHLRIKMTYGDEYGISIDSWESQGTKVTLKIPVQQDKPVKVNQLKKD